METPQPGRRRFSTAPQAPASKPASEATTLRTIYAPVLAYVVLFQRTADKGGVTADKLRQEVRGLLDRAGQQAMIAGYRPEKVNYVRFSVVAFVDEVVLNSDWVYRAAWMERPLQFEEFETTVAGDQFFDRLEGTAEVDPEVAEIDFVILSLGFKGRYVGNDSELTSVRRRLFRKFPPEAVLSVPQLTPEAYETKVEGIEEVEDRWKVWQWVVAGGLAVLVLIVWGLLQWGLGGSVGEYREGLSRIAR
ncbi:MAG: DotU family type IV/VI secretion system protein [Acidobacteriia bacterium]|nr:DotU family type IV/VI secretion system protein [Terriglobia bacterium]